MAESAHLQINHLRLRTTSGDVLNRKLKTSTLLDQGDFHPPGLPPSAILVIRHMEDPLPGEFLPNQANIRLNPAWESSVKGRLESYYRQAARPISGAVPESAPAVVFSDQAEMLACLAMDLHRRLVHDRWWWHSILRQHPLLPDPEGWRRLLCENALQVPNVIGLLQKNHSESALLEPLNGAQSLRILEAVLETYQLGDLLQEVTTEVSSLDPSDNISQRASREDSPGDAVPEKMNPSPVPPWAVALNSGLSLKHWPREQEALRGVCLLLIKYPGLLRTTRFRHSFRSWWATADSGSRRLRDDSSKERLRHKPDSGRQPGDLLSKDISGNPAIDATKDSHLEALSFSKKTKSPDRLSDSMEGRSSPIEKDSSSSNGSPDSRGSESMEIDPGDLIRQQRRDFKALNGSFQDGSQEQMTFGDADQDSDSDNLVLDHDPGTEEQNLPAENQKQMPEDKAQTLEARSENDLPSSPDGKSEDANLQNIDTAVSEPGRWTGESHVHSDLAGILYLVNFLEYLELPEIFEDSWRLATGVSPWALLEIIARGFMGECGLDLWEDSLWRLLAVLDGRDPGTLPGEGYEGSDEFRIPREWIESGNPQDLAITARAWTHSRLAGWAANEILLFDVPRQTTPNRQTNRELSRLDYQAIPANIPRRSYPGITKICITPESEGSPVNGLTRWLGWAMPYLRYRLKAALPDGKQTALRSIRSLLRSSGDIYVTSSHIDVVIPLERISLPARMAGLDRDPGWKPLFGRVILFHFE